VARRILLEFVLGLVSSVIGFFLFSGIYILLESLGLEVEFWGDKAGALFGLFLGLSIGGGFGVLFVERFLYKRHNLITIPLCSAILLGVFGNYLGLIILDKAGGGFVLMLPLLVALLCVIGYNVGLLVVGAKRGPTG
jgi:hypothetical protein